MQTSMISLAVFAYAFFAFSPVQVISLKYSYTNSGNKLCMTGCEHYSNYDYCYLGWGASNWNYCTAGKIPAPQYFASYSTESRNAKCTSLCDYFGYSGKTWCFTGARGKWDFCSKTVGVSVSGNKCTGMCQWQSVESKYQCPVGYGQPTMEDCSKAPDDSEFEQFVKNVISASQGEVLTTGDFQSCPARVKRADEDLLRAIGVHALYDRYALFMTVRYYNNPDLPITSYIVGNAPTRNNIPDVELVYAVRARIYPTHRAVRTAIPDWVAKRFQLMDALPSDERGHLLAASLGGPNHQENFLPQTSILNRSSGGDSYWFRIEAELRRLLDNYVTNHVAYIDWTLVVTYDNTAQNRRPTGYGLRFIARDAAGGVIRDSGDMYFSNDPQGGSCI